MRRIGARLVVGADGRDSRVAEMAGVPARVKPHGRFFYWAYYRGLELPERDVAGGWWLDPDCAYAFPMDDDLTLVGCMPVKEKLPAFRRDIEESFEAFFEQVPEGPRIRQAERTTKLLGKLDLPNASRPAAAKGVAFVGDAALAADPVWGVGCGWAFQSAEWLAGETAAALRGEEPLERALARYKRLHRKQLAGHSFIIGDYSSGRRFNPLDKLLYSAAARDHEVALAFHAVGTRAVPVRTMFTPRNAARMALAAARGQAGGAPGAPRPPALSSSRAG